MKIKIIFPASMKKVGLLYHFTYLSIDFAKELRNSKYSFLMLSEKGEQYQGLWNLIRENLLTDEYKEFDSYVDFDSTIEYYLKNDKYDKVIYLSQGLLQFYRSIKFKRKYGDRFKLYTRLNSFKHGSWIRKPVSFIYSFLFYFYADSVNFQCEYTISIFSNNKLILNKGIDVLIPLGLNNPKMILDNDKDNLNSIMNNKDYFKIVYLAEFHRHKKHFELINSLKVYLKNQKNVRLIFFGDGVEINNIKNIVKREGIDNKVYFAGQIDRKFIPQYLKLSSLSIVLSKAETFGHNILEPLYYGIPVISSNVGIASDVIRDFSNGYVLRSNNYEKLSSVVDVFRRNKLSISTNSTVMNYTWKNTVKSYIKLFDFLIH